MDLDGGVVLDLAFVHLSDIHFTARDTGLARRNASLRDDVLNDIAAMRPTVGDATAVLVTGDIAYSALPAEYEIARDWLDLVAETAGAKPTSVLCVPGNHDVHRDSVGKSGELIRDELRQADALSADGVLDPLLAEAGAPILVPLKNYIEFAAQYKCEIGKEPYWQTEDLALGNDFTLRIHGITTVLASDRRDQRPNMVIGRTQVTLRRDCPKRLYLVMGHHPPSWWHDDDAALDALRHRCSVLLVGHKHLQRIERVDDMLRVTAGAVHPEEGHDWEPRYNWLSLAIREDGAVPQLRVRVWPRVFRPAHNRFVADRQDGELEYAEYLLPIPGVATAEASVEMPSGSEAQDSQVEITLPEAALRPPLVSSSGAAEPQRDIVRAFLRLPYTAQMQVLQELHLLEDDDLGKSHVALVTAALRRARENGKSDELVAAVERVERATE